MAEREEAIVKIQKRKEKQLLLLKLHKKARELLASKGPLTVENATTRLYSKEDIKLLCKWKQADMSKGPGGKKKDKKEDFAALYFDHPEPPDPQPWSDNEESELVEMRKEEVPLAATHLGVAAKQMAVATANNMAKLDRNTRNQLLQSIADIDTSEQGSS